MKIKVVKKSYNEVQALPEPKYKKPVVSFRLFRLMMKLLGKKDLKKTDFTYKFVNLDGFPKEPCLILMNHSAFIDLEIVSNLLYPKPFAIVCTSDGFVGKEFLMRHLGCIPTNKFTTSKQLIPDINYALKTNKTHVLMYPEASYSFDGTQTPLPQKMGILVKKLNVPVVMIRTYGAFHRDPLYNCLKKRNVKVSAEISLLTAKEDTESKSTAELTEILEKAFTFDNFKWQKENNVTISENFRADGLERILYKCPYCNAEAQMQGEGISLTCKCCNMRWKLSELGEILSDIKDKTEEKHHRHIPEWYKWQRDCVRNEILLENYGLDCKVNIKVLKDFKAVYDIGGGRLVHNSRGFSLKSDDGSLEYYQGPEKSYSLYSDYYWYELGDIICIGNDKMLYYCFPENNVPVAKVRLAAEEMYKIAKKSV